MASVQPARVTTDHANAPDPKPAKGVKIAVGFALALLGVVILALWAMVRALG
ncbi:MAG: hypothetical protein K0R38_6991 [Polyangiaceae bacterium]|jgi:hypothetical protein|nr:hypothetical protein [Polyangiaceae bacterium]